MVCTAPWWSLPSACDDRSGFRICGDPVDEPHALINYPDSGGVSLENLSPSHRSHQRSLRTSSSFTEEHEAQKRRSLAPNV